MRCIFIILIVFSFNHLCYSQALPGARQISLSHSDVALSNDVFSIFNNPAGLAQLSWRELGIYYSPAPFGLDELANGCIAYNESFNFGSVSFAAMYYGFDLYKENQLTAGASFKLLKEFLFGLTINYKNISIKKYGSASVFYINAGGLVFIQPELRWGFFLHNINRASISSTKDQLPVVFGSGFSYYVTPEFSASLAFEKDIKYDATISVGIEYQIIKYLSLRVGFANEPSIYSGGIGINYSFIKLDYAATSHSDLGITHQVGIIISLSNL